MVLDQTRYNAAGLDDLAAMRRFVEDVVTAVCPNPDIIADLIIAFNEAVTNVIIHGYQGRPGVIEITVESSERRVRVRIRDQAPAFDPTSLPVPDVTVPLAQRPLGGMGVHMMRQFTDSLVYRAVSPRGNELILEKELD